MTNANLKNDTTVDSERGTLRYRGPLSSAVAGRPGPVPTRGKAGSIEQGGQFRFEPVIFFDNFWTPCIHKYRTRQTYGLHNEDKDLAPHYRQNKTRQCFSQEDPLWLRYWFSGQFLKALMHSLTFLTTSFKHTLNKGYTNFNPSGKIRQYYLITKVFRHYIHTGFVLLQDMLDTLPQLDGTDDSAMDASSSSSGQAWQKAGKKDNKGKAKNSGAGKRGTGGDGGQPPKRPKQTFAEKTREGILVEFRSSVPGAPLVQEDFDHLERTILQHYLDIPEPSFAYRTINSGISQGGVWYACENQETADFLRNLVPGIDPPEGMGSYSYVIGNGELRYIKLKLPSKLWMSRERLVKSLRLQNPSLQTYLDESGQRVNARFHVTAGLEPDREAEARQQQYTYITMEVHVNTVQAIVDLDGEVLIGNSRVRVTGAGIDQLIADRDNQAALNNINNDV